jgi:hypothetical protein
MSYLLLQNFDTCGDIYLTGINGRRLGMKCLLAIFVSSFCLLGSALADEGVIDKTGSALERGAEATSHGIQRGVEAAGHGIKRGAEATGHGIEVGLSAAGRGVRRGAEATGHVMHKVAEKLSPSSGD